MCVCVCVCFWSRVMTSDLDFWSHNAVLIDARSSACCPSGKGACPHSLLASRTVHILHCHYDVVLLKTYLTCSVVLQV